MPTEPGEAVAALPWLLGYRPGSSQLGWVSAHDGVVTAVGVGHLSRAGSAGFAWMFTKEMHEQPVDRLLVVGPEDSARTLWAFGQGTGAAGEPSVECFETSGEHFRYANNGRTGPWHEIPSPPMEVLLSGRPAPAASSAELAASYALLTGPGGVQDALALTHADKAALDRLGPLERHSLTLKTLDELLEPRRNAARVDVAYLAYLLTDPIVRDAVLADVVDRPARVESLVQAHRTAHLTEGAELRGAAAMAVYVTAPRPGLAALVSEAAQESTLARQVSDLARRQTPSHAIRQDVIAPDAYERLAAAERQWASSKPLTSTLEDLQRRLQQLPAVETETRRQPPPDLGLPPGRGPRL